MNWGHQQKTEASKPAIPSNSVHEFYKRKQKKEMLENLTFIRILVSQYIKVLHCTCLVVYCGFSCGLPNN